MSFNEFIESLLDELMPSKGGYPILREVENRHLVRTYLIYGNQEKACELLGVCNRTLRNRLNEIFPSNKLRTLPGSRGRTDIGSLISFVCLRMNECETLEIPPDIATIQHWRLRRNVIAERKTKEEKEEMVYPSHRDFAFFDWYYNLDRPIRHQSKGEPCEINN